MKAKLEQYLRWLREGFVQMLHLHPIEALLIVYGCILCFIAYEQDTDALLPQLVLVPLFFVFALSVNLFAGHGPWRRAYWVSWVPLIPLSFWGGLEAWLQTEPAFLTYGILVPLIVLLCRRAVCNDRFISDVILWLRAGALAVFFASVALGLFCAILFSTTYIFGQEGNWIEHVFVYAVILFEAFVAPTLFLIIIDRWNTTELRGGRILEMLLNYIVTPALLIYTAILYLYMAKILVTWSLPRGGVAYLVFGFTLFAIAVKALQFLHQKRFYDWFFHYFSLISIPTQVLFWFGVMHRTSEYGLTAPRIYLIVCGGLMTLCVLVFLSKVIGRYLYVCLVAFPIFAAFAYIPYLRPDKIAARSQEARVERIATQLGMLGREGRLRLEAFPTDTLTRRDCRKLYESLNYLAQNDSAAFAQLGVTMAQIRSAVPQNNYDYIIVGSIERDDDDRWVYISSCMGYRVEEVGKYKVLYTNIAHASDKEEVPNWLFKDDTLRIDFGKERFPLMIAGVDILGDDLQRLGSEYPQRSILQDSADELLIYANDEVLILFSNMRLERRDSIIRIDRLTVNTLLVR